MNSVEWNPKYNLPAYAGDDKNKYSADEGAVISKIQFTYLIMFCHRWKSYCLVCSFAGAFRIFGFESS